MVISLSNDGPILLVYYNTLKDFMLIRHLIYCLSVAGMLCLLLLPVNQYSWMSQLEPEIIFLPTDPHQSDRAIFSLCLVIAIGIIQTGLALTTPRRTEKILALIIILATTLIWLWRFGG